MLPKLHEDMISAVREKVQIEEIVSQYVVLKRSGKELMGLCPFHDEKTPSFSVSPAKNTCYCFGCQNGGDAFYFMMRVGGFKFQEVILKLAEQYNVPVKTLEPEKAEEVNKLLTAKKLNYQLMADAQVFFAKHLQHNQIALAYLKSRNFDQSVIETYGLGFCPPGDSLWRYLEKKGHSLELACSVGLVVNYSGQIRAFLGDRLMIPIYDVQGKAIAFSGRTLDPEAKSNKYINTKESEIFHKKYQVYGLDKAWKGISQKDEAVIMEGYFDVIRCHSNGILNVVACMGTAISEEQIKLISRYTDSNRIVLNLDSDNAGKESVNKTLEKIPVLSSGCQTKILQLPPEDKDADTFILKKSAIAYMELLESAPLWVQWKIDGIIQDFKTNSSNPLILDKLEIFLKSLAGTTKIMYAEYSATALGYEGNTRRYYIQNILGTYSRQPLVKERQKPQITDSLSEEISQAEATLLSLLLTDFEIFTVFFPVVEQTGIKFCDPIHQQVWEQIKLESGNYESHDFHQLRDVVYHFCLEVIGEAPFLVFYNQNLESISNKSRMAVRAIAYLEINSREKAIAYCTEEWEKYFNLGEYQKAEEYNNAIMSHHTRINEVNKFLRDQN